MLYPRLAELIGSGFYGWRQNTTGTPGRAGQLRTAAKKGVADDLAIVYGHFLGIEIKIGADRMSPEQIGFKKSVEHAGGTVIVVSTMEEFHEKFQAFLSTIPEGCKEAKNVL